MKYDNLSWTKETYQEFLMELDTLADESYQKFHQGLVLEGKPLRGIRTPKLQEIAKMIAKGDFKTFLKLNQMESYEEIILYGLVIAKAKIPFQEQLNNLNDFIPYIDNWAINDIVCSSLKSFKKNQELGLKAIKTYLHSKKKWRIRFGLVLLLDYYINDTYIDTVLKLSNSIHSEEYYVKMANAWLLSICYIKYSEKTMKFFETCDLDDWTYHKAISKINDSRRVKKEEKEKLKKRKKLSNNDMNSVL